MHDSTYFTYSSYSPLFTNAPLKEHFHPYYVLMFVDNTMSILTNVLNAADISYARYSVILEDLFSCFQGFELEVLGVFMLSLGCPVR